ncbi:LacI family DNA-binding transcriptional regulator [Streptomyces sp. NPDC127072]|uniref:LacI family DNA-binding transcriptional regulator n=1 Tax=Streptomyces sp. NPDC127072 TaxID=3347129 RepID=UPI003655CE8F
MARGSTRPTSRDVAQAAGVSQAAVSLVLGDKWRGRVSEATAGRVREAAQELGYRPNLAARNLRLGRTRTVLLVVPALTTEFFAGVYTGAARVAAEHGFGVVLYPSPEGIGPARDPFGSARAALDGVIASSMAADALTAIRGDQLPLVMLDSDPEGSLGAATVNLDIRDGVRQVAEHLLALGHRHFLHLAADIPSWTFEVRARELATRLSEVPGTRLRTARAPISMEGALEAAETALAAPGPRPTALVCDDDKLAAGAYKAARRLGLRIPDDLSVTGLDDLALARAIDPELTTVRLNAELFGEQGMQALLAVLEGRTPPQDDIPVQLVVRGSTAPPGAQPMGS